MVSKVVNSDAFQNTIKWGHLLSLIGALGIVIGYGFKFGTMDSIVKHNTNQIEKHEKLLSQVDRWTKDDHIGYASATERRIATLEIRMDSYMMEIRNRMDKIYERLTRD